MGQLPRGCAHGVSCRRRQRRALARRHARVPPQLHSLRRRVLVVHQRAGRDPRPRSHAAHHALSSPAPRLQPAPTARKSDARRLDFRSPTPQQVHMTLSRSYELHCGRIQGREHRRALRDGQDGLAVWRGPAGLGLAVTDGCGSAPGSEVGARLAATWLASHGPRALASGAPGDRARRLGGDRQGCLGRRSATAGLPGQTFVVEGRSRGFTAASIIEVRRERVTSHEAATADGDRREAAGCDLRIEGGAADAE